MNRVEFMQELEYLLRNIPENDRNDALAYYHNYFDEAGAENEQEVLRELGSPQDVAQMILVDFQVNLNGVSTGDFILEEDVDSRQDKFTTYKSEGFNQQAERKQGTSDTQAQSQYQSGTNYEKSNAEKEIFVKQKKKK